MTTTQSTNRNAQPTKRDLKRERAEHFAEAARRKQVAKMFSLEARARIKE